MSTKDVLLRAAGRKLIDIDGEADVVSLQPPASPGRVAEIERVLGFALPRELAELVRVSAGLDREVDESLDLLSIGPCPWQAPLGQVMNLVGDGAGNSWVVELHPSLEVLGPVWFVCHDAPVLVYQSPDLATFVDDYLRFSAAPHDGPVATVVREAVRRVWTQQDPPSSDPLLRDFARRLGEGWFIRDLRRAAPGDGMPIGRFGPKTPLARAGREFVFAYGSRTRLQRFKTWVTGR
jgi:hypothetical protein